MEESLQVISTLRPVDTYIHLLRHIYICWGMYTSLYTFVDAYIHHQPRSPVAQVKVISFFWKFENVASKILAMLGNPS